MFDVKRFFTRTEVTHSLIPENNISHTRDLLTKTETHRILGGWRRHINPWGIIKHVEKVTQDNLPLRRKVLWSVKQHSNIWKVYSKTLSIIFLFSTFSIIIDSDTCAIISVMLIPFLTFMEGKTFIKINSISEPPILPKLNCSTGYPELDAIFTESSFEVERILIDGGMQLDELKELSAFALAMVNEKRPERQFAKGLVTVTTTVNVSPKAWELVKRATVIMSGGSTPRLLPHASSITGVLDVMEYTGIPVRTGEA